MFFPKKSNTRVSGELPRICMATGWVYSFLNSYTLITLT